MRQRIPSLLLALLALVLALPSAGGAQVASIQGTFVYDAAASDNVNTAINAAVARMNFALRPIARGRLRKTNQPYQRIAISYTTSQVSVALDGRAPIVTPANGTPIDWARPDDGEKLKVSTDWDAGTLKQTFKAEDGQRVNAYSVSADGRKLTMRVTVTSPRLSQALTYNLVYNKQQ